MHICAGENPTTVLSKSVATSIDPRTVPAIEQEIQTERGLAEPRQERRSPQRVSHLCFMSKSSTASLGREKELVPRERYQSVSLWIIYSVMGGPFAPVGYLGDSEFK